MTRPCVVRVFRPNYTGKVSWGGGRGAVPWGGDCQIPGGRKGRSDAQEGMRNPGSHKADPMRPS